MRDEDDELCRREERFLKSAREGLSPSAEERNAVTSRLCAGLGVPLPTLPQPPLDPVAQAGAELASSALPTIGSTVASGSAVSAITLTKTTLGAFLLTLGVSTAVLVKTHQVEKQAESRELSHATELGRSPLRLEDPGVRSRSSPTVSEPMAKRREPRANGHPAPDTSSSPGTTTLPAPSSSGSDAVAKKRMQSRAPTSHPEEPTVSSLQVELAKLRRAQRALRDGQAALALSLTEEMGSGDPTGALWTERYMVALLALCQLGRAGEASEVARALLARSAGQAYRPRISKSCAGGAWMDSP